MQIKADPMSRSKIAKIAWMMREILGLDKILKVDVIDLLENQMFRLFDDYNYQILPVSEMLNEHGLTIPEKRMVYIREDVHLGAIMGRGRDRATIMHELGHFILHSDLSLSFARMVDDSVKLPAFEDPEWQAKAFAGEFLVARPLTSKLSVLDIAEKCGVSLESAQIQWNSMHKRGSAYDNRK